MWTMTETFDFSCVAPEGTSTNNGLKLEIWKTFLKME